jgi:hypothetical protein
VPGELATFSPPGIPSSCRSRPLMVRAAPTRVQRVRIEGCVMHRPSKHGATHAVNGRLNSTYQHLTRPALGERCHGASRLSA